jgi:hypothetical protein
MENGMSRHRRTNARDYDVDHGEPIGVTMGEIEARTEHQAADEEMLNRLALEHPDRAVTDWSTPGTQAPQRLLPAQQAGLQSAGFE